MSKLVWATLLGILLCELMLLASGESAARKYYRRSSYRRRYRPHPNPHPHCPKPKPVPCKPSPCKPVPCKPVPCVPCNKPPVPPPKPCSKSRPSSHKWANNYDESFTFECRKDGSYSIEKVYSLFSSCHHDRIWAFKCGYNKASIPRQCHWSDTNSFGQPVHFRCPNNGFIAGIQSHHYKGNQDRKFRFKCCNKEGYRHKDCTISHEVNDFTETIDYDTQRNRKNYLAGVHSYYNSKTMDRRWKFEVCKMQWSSPNDEELEVLDGETLKN